MIRALRSAAVTSRKALDFPMCSESREMAQARPVGRRMSSSMTWISKYGASRRASSSGETPPSVRSSRWVGKMTSPGSLLASRYMRVKRWPPSAGSPGFTRSSSSR